MVVCEIFSIIMEYADDGDLYQKPSMTILAPGVTASHSVTFEFLDEGS